MVPLNYSPLTDFSLLGRELLSPPATYHFTSRRLSTLVSDNFVHPLFLGGCAPPGLFMHGHSFVNNGFVGHCVEALCVSPTFLCCPQIPPCFLSHPTGLCLSPCVFNPPFCSHFFCFPFWLPKDSVIQLSLSKMYQKLLENSKALLLVLSPLFP